MIDTHPCLYLYLIYVYSEKEREAEKEDNMVEDIGELSWWAWSRE